MVSKKVCAIIVSCVLFSNAHLCFAQPILKPDPSADFDKSKGIIVLTPAVRGTFYMNDHILTEIKGNDTIFVINVNPAIYKIKYVSPPLSLERNIAVYRHKVVEIMPGTDSIRYRNNMLKWQPTAERIAGKPVYFLLKNYIYTIVQVSTINLQWMETFTWFSTITAVAGYQVAQGFCIGAGLSYNHFDIPSSKVYNSPYAVGIENVSALPVFMDLRVNLSDKRVAPFFNFDIGYSILLTKKTSENIIDTYPQYSRSASQVTNGGLHLSFGAGLRIAISKFIQVITSLEYCHEGGIVKYTSLDTGPDPYYFEQSRIYKNNSLRINIGIGLQYR